jgi:hypothetical protein
MATVLFLMRVAMSSLFPAANCSVPPPKVTSPLPRPPVPKVTVPPLSAVTPV